MTRYAKWCLALWLVLCGAAHAQVGISKVELFQSWTQGPYGYLQINLENRSGKALGFRWKCQGKSNYQLSDAVLAAGEKRTFHFPIMGFEDYGWVDLVDSDRHDDRRAVVIRYARVMNIDSVANWPTEVQMQDFSKALDSSRDDLVQCFEPRNLPDNWLCYTPFQVVIISEPVFRSLPAAVRAAIMEYVRMGGSLSVHGTAAASSERVMMGWVEQSAGHPVKKNDLSGKWRRDIPGWMRGFKSIDRIALQSFPYQIGQGGGRWGGLILATLFFILAGPVNYFYFRRQGRIRMLLVSLPAISIVFCLLIGVYFIVAQGFRRQGGTVSITMLDEARAAAFTVARHGVISGLYPLGGFRFDPATAFFPQSNRATESGFEMAIGPDGAILRSGLFKPTVMFHYVTARPFETREKIVIDLSDKSAVNGFESDLADLMIVDDKAALAAGRNVKKGARVVLEKLFFIGPSDKKSPTLIDVFLARQDDLNPDARQWVKSAVGEYIQVALEQPGAHYIARLDAAPESAFPGVSMVHPGQCHILVGAVKTP